MTKTERTTLRELESTATPGRWDNDGDFDVYSSQPIADERAVVSCQLMADADFMVAARNSMRALLDALDDAEAVIDSLRSARVRARMRFGDQSERDPVEDALDAYDAKHGGGK